MGPLFRIICDWRFDFSLVGRPAMKQISYSEAICLRVFLLRNEPCEAIAAKIQKEFALPIRPHRQTIAKILKRGGAPLTPKHQKKENTTNV